MCDINAIRAAYGESEEVSANAHVLVRTNDPATAEKMRAILFGPQASQRVGDALATADAKPCALTPSSRLILLDGAQAWTLDGDVLHAAPLRDDGSIGTFAPVSLAALDLYALEHIGGIHRDLVCAERAWELRESAKALAQFGNLLLAMREDGTPINHKTWDNLRTLVDGALRADESFYGAAYPNKYRDLRRNLAKKNQ